MVWQAKSANQVTADFGGDPGWTANDATFTMTVNTVLGGEFQLANGWGSAATNVFKVIYTHINWVSVEKLNLSQTCGEVQDSCVACSQDS